MPDSPEKRTEDAEILTVLLQLLAIPAALLGFWIGLNLYAEASNLVADGTVTVRREEILFSGDDWHRAFEVSYRYSVAGSEGTHLGTSFVNREVYERLPVGTIIRVHYSRWKLLRLVEGVGSFIEGTSWRSRLSGGAWNVKDWGEAVGLLVAIAFAWMAFKKKSRLFAVLAALLAGAAYPVFLLLLVSLLVFPFLFWMWRKRSSQGYGLLLLATLSVTGMITWWRIPHAQPMPSGTREEAVAVVRQVKTVKRIWTSGHNAPNRGGSVGQNLGRPFYMVDLEFTPKGTSEPLHAVDKIEMASTSPLQRGMTVPIIYSVSDPRHAQIKNASRSYDRTIFRELITTTVVGCALITFVAIPLWTGLSRLSRHLFPVPQGQGNRLFAVTQGMSEHSYQAVLAELEGLPPNDPRRRDLERVLQRRETGHQ